jgi:hypothetical protein
MSKILAAIVDIPSSFKRPEGLDSIIEKTISLDGIDSLCVIKTTEEGKVIVCDYVATEDARKSMSDGWRDVAHLDTRKLLEGFFPKADIRLAQR